MDDSFPRDDIVIRLCFSSPYRKGKVSAEVKLSRRARTKDHRDGEDMFASPYRVNAVTHPTAYGFVRHSQPSSRGVAHVPPRVHKDNHMALKGLPVFTLDQGEVWMSLMCYKTRPTFHSHLVRIYNLGRSKSFGLTSPSVVSAVARVNQRVRLDNP